LNVAQLKDEILKKKKGLIRIGHLPLVWTYPSEKYKPLSMKVCYIEKFVHNQYQDSWSKSTKIDILYSFLYTQRFK
jgi:hypothetical protein